MEGRHSREGSSVPELRTVGPPHARPQNPCHFSQRRFLLHVIRCNPRDDEIECLIGIRQGRCRCAGGGL